MERVKYIMSFTINAGIPLCCSATLEHGLTFCSTSEPAVDPIFLALYLVFTVCFFDNLIVDIILERIFFVSVLELHFCLVSVFYTSTHIT